MASEAIRDICVINAFGGLRMADSTLKDHQIETETKMVKLSCGLLATNEKSSVKY